MYKASVENACGNKIKVLRNESGKEYVKKNLQHIYVESGIQINHFVPYTPQQNGVAEHKNRALKEMATSMTKAKDFPPNIWD